MRNLKKDIENEINNNIEYDDSCKSKQKDRKVNVLETVYNRVLYVSKDVKGEDGRELVKMVVELGARMIRNPDGNFKNEINGIIGVYQVLPQEDKKELISLARENIDLGKAWELVELYWK